MSVDLPTPLPANMPQRCPLPMVSNESMDRTPRDNISCIRGLSNGLIRVPLTE